jgi:hypothetical protein
MAVYQATLSWQQMHVFVRPRERMQSRHMLENREFSNFANDKVANVEDFL